MTNMKIRAFRTEFQEGDYTLEEWFNLSMRAFKDKAPSTDLKDYDHIQIVPLKSYRRYWSGNDGTQAFRHRKTGWTIPDYCRQQGGRPEIWNRSRARQLKIAEDSPVLDYIIN